MRQRNMTAAVMSNYYYPAPSGWRPVANNGVSYQQNWMMAQMAQYPQQAQPNQHQYAIYPATSGPQQLLDSQDQLQYGELSGHVNYPRVDSVTAGPPTSGHQVGVHDLAQQLQPHHGYEEHQQLNQPLAVQPPSVHVHGPNAAHTPQAPMTPDVSDQSHKVNRLRKACDSCSIRKVKCDESGPPCRACTALDIPCTFNRPSRRRGPPNRYAESIKRRRLEEPQDSVHRMSSPSSPTHAAHALAALSSAAPSQQLTAESVGPVQTIDLLIDDFFTYIHPICPFPHEPSFREAWKRREDVTNSAFLALLASMLGTLVASFPKKPRLDINNQRKETRVTDHQDLVNRCHRICATARGVGYLENENLSVYDAATSYFQGLSRLYMHKFRPARLYFAECLSIIRTLGLHKEDEHMHMLVGKLPESLDFNSFSTHDASQDLAVDNITREMGRRIFWALYTTIRSMQQISKEFRDVHFPPSTPTERYPPLPSEVDDYYIYSTHNEPQPPAHLPVITGFNRNVNVFRAYDELSSVESALGSLSIVDRQRQLAVLQDSLRKCKACSDDLPPELDYNVSSTDFLITQGADETAVSNGHAQPRYLQDSNTALMGASYGNHAVQQPEQRRWIQNALQKSTIHASILSTRSYLVQKFWSLYESAYPPKNTAASLGDHAIIAGFENLNPHVYATPPEMIEQEMRAESAGVIKDVLSALGSIKGVNMEANADNFTSKIRTLASKLLEMPDDQGEQDFQEPLSGYLSSLGRLEQINAHELNVDSYDDGETESREWAELQSCRSQLAQLATT